MGIKGISNMNIKYKSIFLINLSIILVELFVFFVLVPKFYDPFPSGLDFSAPVASYLSIQKLLILFFCIFLFFIKFELKSFLEILVNNFLSSIVFFHFIVLETYPFATRYFLTMYFYFLLAILIISLVKFFVIKNNFKFQNLLKKS